MFYPGFLEGKDGDVGPGNQQWLRSASCHGDHLSSCLGSCLPQSCLGPSSSFPLASLSTDRLTTHAQTSPSWCDIVIRRQPGRGARGA